LGSEEAFGDLYFAFGSLSVNEKIFLLKRIVFNRISFLSISSYAAKCGSLGKNFFIRDSMIGKLNI